jgi:sarcosine oxidase subunit beta
MTETAEVVIIGGGAMGTSVAHHLAARGLTDVLLLEQATLGSGSTSKAHGGIRLQFADAVNIQIMLRSVPAFERFHEEVGTDVAFEQVGYLILIGAEASLRTFQDAVALQQSHGVPVELVSPDDARAAVPQLVVDDLLAATWCPRDGHATPESLVQGYAAAAAARGVKINQGREVTGIRRSGGRITAVETNKGVVETSCVVCTAGVGSAKVGAFVDVDLPVTGAPRWSHFSANDCGLPDPMPLTIDYESGFALHREGPGLLFGGRESDVADLAVVATRRIPALASLAVQSSWWGDYDMSPDGNAMIGEAAEVSRFFYATGFSGHGFQQSPAVGEHLAELIAGSDPTLDLTPLSKERFAGQDRRSEAFVI